MMARHVHQAITIITALVVIPVLCSCASPAMRRGHEAPRARPKPKINVADLERKIHVLINKERRKQGLQSLEWNNVLARIADNHSRDMAKRNYFDHYSPEGRDFSSRYRQEGFSCAVREGETIHMGAENIALNNLYDTVTTVNNVAYYDWNTADRIAETTVQGWIKSPGHRKNILTPYFKSEGIGVVISPDDKVYVTQNFC
jgi:uncharacterized protein YkwD